jgi:hypothetical protein
MLDSGMVSPHVALYRPPEDITTEPGYFDRSPLASSSKSNQQDTRLTTGLGKGKMPMARGEEEDVKLPQSSGASSDADVEAPLLRMSKLDDDLDRIHERLDRIHGKLAEMEQNQRRELGAEHQPIVPVPARAPVEEDEDEVDEDAQDVEPMGDDDMDGALEGEFTSWSSSASN